MFMTEAISPVSMSSSFRRGGKAGPGEKVKKKRKAHFVASRKKYLVLRVKESSWRGNDIKIPSGKFEK